MPAPKVHTQSTGSQVPLGERGWFNALWFQGTWLCLVLGREQLLPLGIALLALHLMLVSTPLRELRQLALVGVMGMTVDASLSALGLYQFADDALLPLWLLTLWLAFATTPCRSLAFLGNHTVLLIIAGAVAMPLNYWAGQRLGAVEFPYPLVTTGLVISCVWAVLLPLLFRFTTHLAGNNCPQTAT